MINWKTTLAGIFGAIAAVLSHQPGVLGTIGTVAVVIAPAIAGAVAKDNNVTGGTVTQPSK